MCRLTSIRSSKLFSLLLVAWIALPLHAVAQVRQVRHFSFGAKQPTWTLLDLNGYFEQQALAVTSSGDFLSLSAKRDGIWHLHRIRNWSTEKPLVESLDLSGYYSSHDQRDLDDLRLKLYVTPDNNYAICVGAASWLKRVSGKPVGKARTESILTIIDLSVFKIVNNAHLKPDEPFGFQSVEMDRDGQIIVDSSVFGEERHGELMPLDIPSLRNGPKCAYKWVADKQNVSHAFPTTPELCDQLLHSVSVEEYFKLTSGVPPRSPNFTCTDTGAEYCPEPDKFTKDGKFGLGYRTEGHDTILGSWVQTRATAVLFSTARHAEIGEIDMTHVSPKVTFATANGQNYLLSLNAGSELSVYQLSDPVSLDETPRQ